MPQVPNRVSLIDELGFAKSAPDGHALVQRGSGRQWLLLGLGPDPAALAASLPAITVSDGKPMRVTIGPDAHLAAAMPEDAEIFYLECPAFAEQAGPDWQAAIPANWTPVDQFTPHPGAHIIFYQGGLRLFPGFWAPVLAALALPAPGDLGRLRSKTVFMPATKDKLLTRELASALAAEGYQVLSPPGDGLAAMLKQGRPDLYLCVNFHGLDDYGQAFSLLERAEVPVAVWCVDNPFHALSGLKSPFWRKTHIFVTDDWYIPALKEHGAEHVHHLPLAASQGFFQARPDIPELAEKLLFVGRSAFPGRDGFFAGLTPPAEVWSQALAMLRQGERPDFGWWRHRLGVGRLWPGKEVRLAGVGAEESGRVWRAMVLAEAARAGDLVVYGDAAWGDLVRTWGAAGNASGCAGGFSQNAHGIRGTRDMAGASLALRPPVDYYGPLAGMYASARVTLGATSPLLPHGLTQRHFDVWAAGGLMVGDATPGLALFPTDLAEAVTFRKASDIPATLARLEADSALRNDLIQAWRSLIQGQHTYAQRIATILERLKA